MNSISAEEAGKALQQIEASRQAMRAAIRANRGHLHLWMWGLIWVAMAVIMQNGGKFGEPLLNWLGIGGVIGSFVIGFWQGRRVRSGIDGRFVGAVISLLVFGYAVWPALLGVHGDHPKALLTYSALVIMQIYILAGLWFDICLLWTGILVTIFLLAGLLLFAPIFYWLFAIFGGGTLIGTGFYLRYVLR
jgi:hypothetical protein